MHIVRAELAAAPTPVIGVLTPDSFAPLPVSSLAELWRREPADLRALVETARPGPIPAGLDLLAPVDGRTEVWAAGVTYLRSRDARIQESAERSVYDRVYAADRPELFFKSVAWRVRTDGDTIGIRFDSADNVPEPELAVVFSPTGAIHGYLVSDDVSSRTIEGENPLYLPQAKVYDGSCALSPGIRPAWLVDEPFAISMTIHRSGDISFQGTTSTADLRRRPAELIRYLLSSLSFPDGVVLSTGTGIVPPLGDGLRIGDEVAIEIEGVGRLTNTVVGIP